MAGQNINMVTGLTFPQGDPYLQKQTEGSVAVSTRRNSNLLGGSNDSRGVDFNLVVTGETGDSWISYYTSYNGGQTWRSNLLPGCTYPTPQCTSDPSSPIKGQFATAADPVIRSGPAGLFYYSALYANRGDNPLAGIGVTRFVDRNDAERVEAESIRYLDTKLVDSGTSGRFVDKPWLAVGRLRNNETCVINGTSYPAHDVYLAWAVFTGSSSSKVNFARSTDCGNTWSKPVILSESNSVNQGLTLAVDPVDNTVWIAWRRFKTSSQPDAIVWVKSRRNDSQISFTKSEDIPGYPGVPAQPFQGFDQPGSASTFRTNAYPSLAVSVDRFNNRRVHVAWAQRGLGPGGDARIVLATSVDGGVWTAKPVDNPAPVIGDPAQGRGHQFMPALTYAGGKLMVAYYSAQEDSTVGQLECVGGTCSDPSVARRFSDYREKRVGAGNLPLGQLSTVFNDFIADANVAGQPPLLRRHSIDVRMAQAYPEDLIFSATRVSRYAWGSLENDLTRNFTTLQQRQFNIPNLPLYQGGERPFIGDYMDLSSVPYTRSATGVWEPNVRRDQPGWAHVIYTSNQDVVPPPPGKTWKDYTPPGKDGNCDSTTAGMRNQNVYTSVVSDGLAAFLLSSAKPDSAGRRTYVVSIANSSLVSRLADFALEVTGGGSITAPDGTLRAYFLRQDGTRISSLANQTVAPGSSVARVVFLDSGINPATVRLRVTSGVIQTFLYLTSDINNPVNVDLTGGESYGALIQPAGTSVRSIVNADATNLDLVSLDLVSLDLVSNQPINLDLVSLDLVSLDLVSSAVKNLDLVSLDLVSLDLVSLDLVSLDMVSSSIVNQDLRNLDLVSNQLSDTAWTIKNTGSTTTSYNVRLATRNLPTGATALPAGVNKKELILYKTNKTPVVSNRKSAKCIAELPVSLVTLNSNPPIFGITDPNLGNPDMTSGDPNNATISLAPGEEGRFVLRLVGTPAAVENYRNSVRPLAVAHPTRIVTLLIVNDTSTLTIERGVPVNFQFRATGNTGAIVWNSPNLPAGLNLDGNSGLLTGTLNATGTFTFTVVATDGANTQEKDQFNFTVNITDTTPPTLTFQSAKLGSAAGPNYTPGTWTNQAVLVTYGCVDNPAGPVTLTPAMPATLDVAAGTGSNALALQVSCKDGANNTVNASYGPVWIDRELPAISITTPAAGAQLTVGQSVTPVFNCSDAFSGVNTCTVTAAIDTATPGTRTFTVTATDRAGNTTSSNVSYTVVKLPPSISIVRANTGSDSGPAYTAGAWTNQPVFVTFACTDTPAGGTVTLAPGNPVVVDVAAGTSGNNLMATATCTDAYNNSVSTSFQPVRIDKQAPAITITTPAANAVYNTGQSVTPQFQCSDVLAGIANCTVTSPLNTATAGAKTFTVTATDLAGNTASASVAYTVRSPFQFTGFSSPLGAAGTFSGSFNTGRNLTLKWELRDSSGVPLTTLDPIVALTAQRNTACPALPGSPVTGTAQVLYPSATGGTILRVSGQYVFNWDTTGYAPGCWTVSLSLTDGRSYATTVQLNP